MVEAISEWTTEITGWHLIMIFSVLVGMAIAAYGIGVQNGAEKVGHRLADLGIVASDNENLITVYDPESDKVILKVTWDDNEVVMTQYDLDEQEWQSDEFHSL